jgi:hypothetical protein
MARLLLAGRDETCHWGCCHRNWIPKKHTKKYRRAVKRGKQENQWRIA